MKQNNNTRSKRFGLIVSVLIIIAISLTVSGTIQDKHAKVLFATMYPSASSLSSSDQTKESNNLSTLDDDLEDFYNLNGYYPATLAPSEFDQISNSDGSSIEAEIQQASSSPTSVTYVYKPSPTGCESAAKTCQHFELIVIDKDNNVVDRDESLN